MRGRAGFPTTYLDGTVVYSQTNSTPTPRLYVDEDLTAGWYYYAMFLLNMATSEWLRVGVADVLMPYDYQSTEILWAGVPNHYRFISDNRADYGQDLYQINPQIYLSSDYTVHNDNLLSFLDVFGWGLDIIHTQVDSIVDGYNTSLTHVNRLSLLAEQFGTHLESVVPAQNNRNLVRNLALLYRMRGTPNGLEELLALAIGWDIEVVTGPNLMLSTDQADFTSPVVPAWDPAIRYVTGDRVKYGLFFYQALQPAFGITQAPNILRTANAYWDPSPWVTGPVVERPTAILRDDTGDISTWQVYGPAGAIPGTTSIGTGIIDPVDGSLGNVNSLVFTNPANTPTDYILQSVPRYTTATTLYDRTLVAESGVPVVRPLDLYSTVVQYYTGDQVLYKGAPYEALGMNLGIIPTDTSMWKRLGYDSRVRMCLSFYTHGAYNGTVGTGGVTVYPFIATFNEKGDLLREVPMAPAAFAGVMYDSFNVPGTVTSGRPFEVGGVTWGGGINGNWSQGADDNGGYAYPTASGRTLRIVDTGSGNGNVAATFRSVGTRQLGLIFRYTTNNFWLATQTGLFKVVASAAPANPASGAVSWPAFVAGDRMTVVLSGSSITVKKNGVTVGTATDAFNSTATNAGIDMEA